MLEINNVYHMDCFDFLDNVKDSSVNLAVIDPPYDMKKAEWDDFENHEAFLEFTYKWIDKVIDKLDADGSLYIFNTPYNCAFLLQYLVSKGLHYKNWITWDKRDGQGGAKRKYSTRQETALFFTKSNKHTFNFNDIRVPYESTSRIEHAKKKGILKNGKRWFPNPLGKLCGDVWHFTSQRHKEKVNGKVVKLRHITPKPHDLIERIIKASSNPNDVVLDCFSGSGTTAIVSKRLGRNYICCDNKLDYVNLSINDLKNTEVNSQYDYSIRDRD